MPGKMSVYTVYIANKMFDSFTLFMRFMKEMCLVMDISADLLMTQGVYNWLRNPHASVE